MSKERQRLRAQREAERERAAAERARRDARTAGRRDRIARVARLMPRRPGRARRSRRPKGILARRRREQNAIVAVVFLLVQVVAWINLASWTARLAVLVLSAFLVPVFVTLAFDRRS
jgi:hypothetical protein